jgi:hypothetical protein
MNSDLATMRARRDALMVILGPLEKLHLLAESAQATEAKGQDLRAQVSDLSRKIKRTEASNSHADSEATGD